MPSPEQIVWPPAVIHHAMRPRHYGPLHRFNGHARVTGPCGDTMEFWLLVREGTVERVSFVTDGGDPSLACGSMATCLVQGAGVDGAATIGPQDILHALGGLPEQISHCAVLAARTLRAAYEDYRVTAGTPESDERQR
jgi:nitrogen fixation NifU-like protein